MYLLGKKKHYLREGKESVLSFRLENINKHFDVNRFALIIRRQFSKDPYYLHTSFLLYNGTDFNSIFNFMFTVIFY